MNNVIPPLAGGSLIGLSATTLLLGNGDILGASGIVRSIALEPKKTLKSWKTHFMISFLATSKLYTEFHHIIHNDVGGNGSSSLSSLGYILSGFLVGFGTGLGNGCTSGHGICGLARLSKRSFVAVMSFMSTGVLAATCLPLIAPVAKLLWNESNSLETLSSGSNNKAYGIDLFSIGVTATCLAASLALTYTPSLSASEHSDTKTCSAPSPDTKKKEAQGTQAKTTLVAALSGSLFSVGLGMSGMTEQEKIYGFLDVSGLFNGTWDPSLLFVMGGGLLVSITGYQLVEGHNFIKHSNTLRAPLTQSKGKFNVPCSSKIDSKLIMGSSIFGIGWGLGGVCPGPAIFSAVNGVSQILFQWLPCFILGSAVSVKAKRIL